MSHSQSLTRIAAALSFSALAASSLGVAQNISTFIPVTPCRMVDTRGGSNPAAIGGPILTAATSRSFAFAGNCGLPTNASAYSVNVTLVPPGIVNYVTLYATGGTIPLVSTMNDIVAGGTVLANAAIVPAGTAGAVSVYVSDTTHVLIDVNGYFVTNTSNATSNTALGLSSLPLSTGAQNSALGFSALGNNTTGNYSTAIGANSLSSNSVGSGNTAVGQSSLATNASGNYNTAVGYQALFSSTSDGNIAIGFQAGLGLGAAGDNIMIGNQGAPSDGGVIRIGSDQGFTFIAGINGATVTGSQVIIDGNGQMGTILSSRRYKEDIHPMGGSSDRLMQLDPVTFHYKQAAADGSKNLQYGLIAEQVADVYPELAVYGKDGQVETLQYQQLPAMLLNEIQKQHRTIQDLETRIAALEELLKANTAPVAH
jgi:hypothetical protein